MLLFPICLQPLCNFANYNLNQLQVHDNIEQIFYLAVRYDLLKAHVEEIVKNNKQVNTNPTETITVVGNQEYGSVVETNVEQRSSIINHENTAALEENAGNKKDEQINRSQVFLHCDVCKRTFNGETGLKIHKEKWKGTSWSCAGGAIVHEKRFCRACNVSYLDKDTVLHQKICRLRKADSCEESVNTFKYRKHISTHKRAYPDVENQSEYGGSELNNHGCKISKRNNYDDNITTKIKEEHDTNICDIDIKEETIEEEDGIKDPLSTIDSNVMGSAVQTDPCLPVESSVQEETNDPHSENIQQKKKTILEKKSKDDRHWEHVDFPSHNNGTWSRIIAEGKYILLPHQGISPGSGGISDTFYCQYKRKGCSASVKVKYFSHQEYLDRKPPREIVSWEGKHNHSTTGLEGRLIKFHIDALHLLSQKNLKPRKAAFENLVCRYQTEIKNDGLDDGEFIALHVSYGTVNTTSKRRRKANATKTTKPKIPVIRKTARPNPIVFW